jgi:hypothetical protein
MARTAVETFNADSSVPTAQGVTESQQALNDLARLSSELQALVNRFRYYGSRAR